MRVTVAASDPEVLTSPDKLPLLVTVVAVAAIGICPAVMPVRPVEDTVATIVEPLKLSPAPRLISEGAAADPVGLPSSRDAARFCTLPKVTALLAIFAVVTALAPIVVTSAALLLTSPDRLALLVTVVASAAIGICPATMPERPLLPPPVVTVAHCGSPAVPAVCRYCPAVPGANATQPEAPRYSNVPRLLPMTASRILDSVLPDAAALAPLILA